MEFEWNPEKETINCKKHGISFDEATEVFGDILSTIFPDVDHSIAEMRYLLIGISKRGKILVISHTERCGNIRIISAREATAQERKFYEDGK